MIAMKCYIPRAYAKALDRKVAIRRRSTQQAEGSDATNMGLRGWWTGVGGRLSWSKHVASLHGVNYEYNKAINTNDYGTIRAKLKGWSLQNALIYTFK